MESQVLASSYSDRLLAVEALLASPTPTESNPGFLLRTFGFSYQSAYPSTAT